ncbi:MAG: hypothetical protein KA010_00665 [Saprospiraceae bacterium]|nr:hypothetical protein [Saprospiraceae bacterium]
MTLQEFFNLLGEHPSYLLLFFGLIPFTALLVLLIARGEGHLNPWPVLYSALIYLVSVPALFSISLSIYFFIFERRSILETDMLTQILPVVSMFLTLFLIRRNVSFDYIPGFDKLSGLVTMIAAVLAVMWLLDKTHLYVISYLPFYQVLIIFVLMLLLVRFGWSKLFGGE